MNLQETIDFLNRETQINDLKAIMGTPEGRRFFWRLLGGFEVSPGIFHASFVPGSADTTFFNEGARNLLLAVLGEIMKEAPGSFLLMQKEAIENEERQQAFRNANRETLDRDAGSGAADN